MMPVINCSVLQFLLGVVNNHTIKSYDHAGCANDRVTEKLASLDGKAKVMHWSFCYIVSKSLFVTHGS